MSDLREKAKVVTSLIDKNGTSGEAVWCLSQQLQEKDAEIAELRGNVKTSLELWKESLQDLAATQAVNAKLRKLVYRYRYATPLENQPHTLAHLAEEALAIPADDTVLREMISRTIDVTRRNTLPEYTYKFGMSIHKKKDIVDEVLGRTK